MSPKSSAKSAAHSSRGTEKLLGELELAIMRVAWGRPSVTVRDVLTVLLKKRRLAYTTVMTIMTRLRDKGLLVLLEKQGKTYTYRAALTEAEFERLAAGQVVQSLLSDFGGELALSQFVQQLAETDPEQLSRLEALARQAQAGQDDD